MFTGLKHLNKQNEINKKPVQKGKVREKLELFYFYQNKVYLLKKKKKLKEKSGFTIYNVITNIRLKTIILKLL